MIMVYFLSCLVLAATAADSSPSSPLAPSITNASTSPTQLSTKRSSLGELAYWDDGLAEMSYYRAVEVVYGRKRDYTRAVLMNRQWMNRTSGVKTSEDDADAVAVFKITIADEIPTDNYNYRFMTTVFVEREDLSPFKMVSSSQDWCGTSFKHLRWLDDGMSMKSFSYFGGEGDREWHDPGNPTPHEALFVLAREVAARVEAREVSLMLPMRSAHEVEPVTMKAVLVPKAVTTISAGNGTFEGRRIDVVWDGPPTGFVVQAAPPYRVLRYRVGTARGELQHFEKRAYWNTRSKSAFYEPGKAP